MLSISIHVPTKGTTTIKDLDGLDKTNFNPRTHEGYDFYKHNFIGLDVNFNPRTHEGYDMNAFADAIIFLISIHVPTKGTTAEDDSNCAWHCGFQSTYPRRVRPRLIDGLIDRCKISIHVPTKGTTDVSASAFHSMGYFNPRTHEGYDITFSSIFSPFFCHFNPRTHEGYDFTPSCLALLVSYFNPRTHEGYDADVGYSSIYFGISIHVPTKGTTLIPHGTSPLSTFQSTYPRRVRQ